MAYDSTNKILSTEGSGITLWEIAQCLGDYRVNTAGRRDVGILCTSPKINKWAKYKPFECSTFGVATEAQRKDASFGITLSARTADSQYSDVIRCSFKHDPPVSAFRLLDFDGYNHKAENPMRWAATAVSGKRGAVSFGTVAVGDEAVDFRELGILSGWYNNQQWEKAYLYARNESEIILLWSGLTADFPTTFSTAGLDPKMRGTYRVYPLFPVVAGGNYYGLHDAFENELTVEILQNIDAGVRVWDSTIQMMCSPDYSQRPVASWHADAPMIFTDIVAFVSLTVYNDTSVTMAASCFRIGAEWEWDGVTYTEYFAVMAYDQGVVSSDWSVLAGSYYPAQYRIDMSGVEFPTRTEIGGGGIPVKMWMEARQDASSDYERVTDYITPYMAKSE